MDYKIYVRVRSETDVDGNVLPTHIIWSDDRVFPVDRVLDVQRRASTNAGGLGMRYTVRIHGKERYLFFENPRWFVEGK